MSKGTALSKCLSHPADNFSFELSPPRNQQICSYIPDLVWAGISYSMAAWSIRTCPTIMVKYDASRHILWLISRKMKTLHWYASIFVCVLFAISSGNGLVQHWNGNVVILTKTSSLVAPNAVKMTASAASDWNIHQNYNISHSINGLASMLTCSMGKSSLHLSMEVAILTTSYDANYV